MSKKDEKDSKQNKKEEVNGENPKESEIGQASVEGKFKEKKRSRRSG